MLIILLKGEKEKSILTLKVAEAEQRDVGRKIARIDPLLAERLNITTGDALELSSGARKTTVLSWPARENDRGKGPYSY
jgi:transitional endoplasmic reticulum ATPase